MWYPPVMRLVSPEERWMHIMALCEAITKMRPHSQLDNRMTYNRATLESMAGSVFTV